MADWRRREGGPTELRTWGGGGGERERRGREGGERGGERERENSELYYARIN